MQIAEILLQFENRQGGDLPQPTWHVMITEDGGRLRMYTLGEAMALPTGYAALAAFAAVTGAG